MDEGSSASNVDADAFGHRQSQRRERPTLHWIKRCKNATCGRGCRDNKTDRGNTRWHNLQVRIGLEALGAYSPLRQVIRAACRAAGAGGEAKAISRARKYSLGSSVVRRQVRRPPRYYRRRWLRDGRRADATAPYLAGQCNYRPTKR